MRCAGTSAPSRVAEGEEQQMKRKWFRDDDGTYFRNIRLIMDEKHALLARPFAMGWQRKVDALSREFDEAWTHGVVRADKIGRRDIVVTMAPFRDVYPDRPGFWLLDELSEDEAA